MPRGRPDYQGVDTRSEITLRQNLLFPTGRAFLVDSYSDPSISYTTAFLGAGTITRSTVSPLTGPACLKIDTGAVANNWSAATYNLGLPRSYKIGFEVAFSLNSAVNTTFTMYILRYDGTNQHFASIYYDQNLGHWRYINNLGAPVFIPGSTMTFHCTDNTYHRAKMSIDSSTGQYLWFEFDNYVFDMRNIPYQTGLSAVAMYMLVAVRITTSAAVAKTARIDNIAVTEED